MKYLRSARTGVDQGSTQLFSDYEDGGPMWEGDGDREVRVPVRFSEPYLTPPVVHASVSMWDTDGNRNQRADLSARDVTCEGFDLVFMTWGDSRFARARADWIAIGELSGEDDWEVD